MRFRTATPYPLMPSDMTQVVIVSKSAAKATTDDFNTGKAAIGTGPYKLVRYAKGDRIELARNDAYWGGKTPWEKVTLRLLPQDASRVAALLSGDVQVIENVPTSDVAQLRKDKRLAVYRTVADRLIYLHMDSDRDVSPFVTDKAGKPLAKNPLKDPRVRKAISKAINRPVMVEKVMEGEAIPAGQLVPDFLFGAIEEPEGRNVRSRRREEAAGRGRLPRRLRPHDPRAEQPLRQRREDRAGRRPDAGARGHRHQGRREPSSTFFTQATDLKFSFMLLGWSTGTGEASSSLKALLMTYNRDKGYGTANRGRYSNGKVDALTEDALATVDDAKREALLQRAAELAINDTGIVPLHFQVNLWATRDGITLCAAHRREHAGVEVPARRREVTGRAVAPDRPAPMNAPHPLPPITTRARHFIGNRWVDPADGRDAADDRPVGRQAVRGDRVRRRPRMSIGGACRPARARRHRGAGSLRWRRAACSRSSGARFSTTPTSSR